MASWLATVRRMNGHNVSTFRRAPLAEISGSLGDLGTLLPLMIALAVQGSIHLGSTLVFSGVFNILTGVVFGIPLPVQPMKVRYRPAVHLWPATGEMRADRCPSCRLLPRPLFRDAGTRPWASSLLPASGSAPLCSS